MSYSPDGIHLASASEDQTIKLWDAHTGAETATLRGHAGWVFSAYYSPDGSHLASASADQTVKLWDTRSAAELATLRGHTGPIASIRYSPDGTRLASASYDRTVKVWDAHSGAEVATLRGHINGVTGVCYSPDGTCLASASNDQTVKMWDARSIALAGTLRGFDPWTEDHQRRAVLAPVWHAEDAAAAEAAGNTFAAAFHRRQLAQGDNLRLLAWSRMASGDQAACLEAIDSLRQPHRLVSDLAPAGPVLAIFTAGPTLALSNIAMASPLEREKRRLAAQLVRAAALLPQADVPAGELVALARSCTAAEPESWQARELLGAALYRDGKAGDAVGELDEAVRRYGKGGSLWSKLFLALAHRRLGHAEWALEYRQQALTASGWEEGVLQAQLLGELDRQQKKP